MTTINTEPVHWPEGTLLERRAIFIYEAARMQAMAANAPIVPEPWPQRESKFRNQFLNVIKMMMSEDRKSSPEELHDDWVKSYEEMGWRQGPKRSVILKEHPDMVPFDELEPSEQAKDAVFVALCELARQWIVDYTEPQAMNILGGFVLTAIWLYGVWSLLRLAYVKTTPLRHKVKNREPIKAAISLNENDRFIQDQEHQIWPDATFEHVNCAVCGPGPLHQGTVPSVYAHPFFRKEMRTHDDGYGTWQVEELIESNGANAEMVSSAVIKNGKYNGEHTVMLDLDFPVTLVQSTTAGHHHLYIDHLMTWRQYSGLLKAMNKVGLIEDGYYRAAVRQSATMLRPPWVKKTLPPARPPKPNRPSRPSPPPNAKPWDRYRRGGRTI